MRPQSAARNPIRGLPWRRGFLPALVLWLVAVPAAHAQESTPPPDVFGEVIEVRVVNVEVVVTDRDGNRVTGLDPASFRLFVDGEEVSIDYFSEVLGGELRKPPAGEPSLPGIPSAGVDAGRVGTNYLVFIDEYFSLPRDRDAVLEALAEELAHLGPDDRMAIVAHDGSQVEMISSWTDSERELRRALGDAKARRTFGLQRLSESATHAGFYRDLLRRQVGRSLDAAVAALRGFAAPEGRKVMLLLSGGWPFSLVPPAELVDRPELDQTAPDDDLRRRDDDLSELMRSTDLDDALTGGARQFRKLADTANLLGYTLYPVDVPGMAAIPGMTPASADRESWSLRASEVRSPAERRSRDAVFAAGSPDREIADEDSLVFLAQETGGRALRNAQSLDALREAAGDTRSYYWLGFAPDRQRDDRRHAIRVEVTEPGLRVRTRQSFLDLSPQAERTMAVESALLFGEPASEGALPVEVGEIRPDGRRFIQVPLTVAIPLDAVTALPADGEWRVQVELRVAALDEKDRQSEVAAVPLELALSEAPQPGKYLPYQTTLKMRRAKQVLVVTLTDVVGGKSLSARVEVDPRDL